MSYIYPVWVKKGKDFEFPDPEAVRYDTFEGDNLLLILMKSEHEDLAEVFWNDLTGLICYEKGKYSHREWGISIDEYSEACITKVVLEKLDHPKRFVEFTLEGWAFCDFHIENAIGTSLIKITEVQLGEDL